MSLELKQHSQWFYARIMHQGRVHRFNLNVRIAGKPPARLSQHGDAAFERSRGQAMKAHEALLADLEARGNTEELTQRILAAKTGQRKNSVALVNLAQVWSERPRSTQPSAGHLRVEASALARFAAFVAEHHPEQTDLLEVKPETVAGFLKAEQERGLTARTWNGLVAILRAVFRRLEPDSEAFKGYLRDLQARKDDTIHREPFTEEEIKDLLRVVQKDELMRPLLLIALYTAMRKGDCASLQWSAVNLKEGFIKTRAHKTGEWVEIPIAQPLRKELVTLHKKSAASPFVLPEAAELYAARPDALDNRLALIFAQAGVGAEGADAPSGTATPTLPALTVEEMKPRLAALLAQAEITTARRQRLRRMVDEYLDGSTVPAIAKGMQVSRSTVFSNLEWLESRAGFSLLRKSNRPNATAARRAVQTRGPGRRVKRASLKGFHSFRTTFITHALNNGMPEQLLRRITGHSSVDIVLKHYYRPRREDLRRAFEMSVRFDA